MATQKKTAEVDYSMQEKILALYDLQKIDSQIDSINKVKGELPLEVQDLDDELAGLKARVENINAEIEELNALSSSVSARWIRPRYSSAITRSSRTTSGTTASSMRLVRRSSIRSWKSSWPKSV